MATTRGGSFERYDGGGGVASLFGGLLPLRLAGLQREADKSGVLPRPADVHDDHLVHDDRGAAGSEVAFLRGELAVGLALPERGAAGEVVAGEDSLGSEGHDLVADDRGCAEGPVTAADLGAEGGAVGLFPEGLSGPGVEAFDDLIGVDAVKEDQAFSGDDGAGVAGADGALPDDGGIARPFGEELFVGRRDAVAVGAEDLWPVSGSCGRGEGPEQESECKSPSHVSIPFRRRDMARVVSLFPGERLIHRMRYWLKPRPGRHGFHSSNPTCHGSRGQGGLAPLPPEALP